MSCNQEPIIKYQGIEEKYYQAERQRAAEGTRLWGVHTEAVQKFGE